MKKIGILGGMGPRATVQFEQMLIDKVSGSDQNIPSIVSMNDGAIPDRTAFLLGFGEDPVPRIIGNGLVLQNAGVDIICMPCNTACVPAIFDRVQSALRVPVVNLPEVVVDRVKTLNIGRVLLMGTFGTMQFGSYQKLLEVAGIDFELPNQEMSFSIQEVITSVKTADMMSANTKAEQIASNINARDFGAIILGCTELPLVKNLLLPDDVLAIDTLDVLVDVTLDIIGAPVKETYATR